MVDHVELENETSTGYENDVRVGSSTEDLGSSMGYEVRASSSADTSDSLVEVGYVSVASEV
jgi:hypothetical protein